MPPVRDRYLNDKILTATPTELIQMLLDRCVVEMDLANDHLANGARAAATPHLRRAQDIVSELRAALRLEVGQMATNLDAIYAFAFRELVEAQLTGVARLDGPGRAIAEIRDGWRDAFSGAAGGQLSIADPATAPAGAG
jgi:flagellar secretion chaperone FliS